MDGDLKITIFLCALCIYALFTMYYLIKHDDDDDRRNHN